MHLKLYSFIKYAIASKFSKGVGTLVFGTSASYALAFVFMPIVTRIYTESEIGIYNSLIAIIGIVGSFVNLRLDLAIPTIKSETEAFHLFELSLSIGTLVAVPFAILFYIFQLNNYFNFQEYPTWSPLIFFVLTFLNTLYVSLQGLLFKFKNYSIAAKSHFINMFVRGGVQTSKQFFGGGGLGLILGEFFARIVASTVILINGNLFNKIINSRTNIKIHHLNVKKYKNYLLFIAPSSLLTSLVTMSIVPTFFSLYGSAISGQFALALTVAIIPITIIGKSAGDVFVGFLSTTYHAGDKNKLLGMFLNTFWVTFIASLVSHVTLAVVSETAFPILFGENWVLAGQFCIYLAIGNIFTLPVVVLEKILFTYKKEKVKLYFDASIALGLLIVFGLSVVNSWSPIQLIQTFIIIKTAIAIIELSTLYWLAKQINKNKAIANE